MAITPHTTRSPGTILTAAIYNEDHERHVANAIGLVEDATDASAGAAAARDKAQEWAENPEDVEVETDQFSALHHATKASASAAAAATSETNAGIAETNSGINADAAAVSAINAAAAKGDAETAADNAAAAKEGAEAAKEASEGFRNETEGFRNEAEAFRDQAEAFAAGAAAPEHYGIVGPRTKLWLQRIHELALPEPRQLRTFLMDHVFTRLEDEVDLSKFDLLYLLAQYDEGAALLNLVDLENYTLSKNGGLTFGVDEGFTGNGTNAWLDTGFNPAEAPGRVYAQASAHIGAFTLSNVDGNLNYAMGQGAGSTLRMVPQDAGGALRNRINQGSNSTGAVPSGTGLFIANRSGASATQHYRNSTLIVSDTIAASGPSANANITLLRSLNDFGTHKIGAAMAGGSLTAGEVEALHDITEEYLGEVGAI